jgi:asparagine synthase (glutamine-hydrolysing)
MCGLLISINSNISDKLFMNGLSAIEHRGPDSKNNLYKDKELRMGHHRLAICDLSSLGNQPMVSSNGKYVIVFNGQIYNYKELKKKYEIVTTSNSDTEIILCLYEKLGPKMLNLLNGDFAFAIFNKLTRKIFVARDRLGIKPLYFWQSNGSYIFSSEVKPIVLMLNSISIDLQAKEEFLNYRTYFGGRTPFNEIKEFPAGHYFDNMSFTSYWELPLGDSRILDILELESLIEESIKLRKIGDVKATSLLSGGIDSSLITHYLNPTESYSIGSELNNEFAYVDILNPKIKKNKYVYNSDFKEESKAIIRKYLYPIGVPNEVYLFKLFEKVSKNYKIVLSGEGADEVFLGYFNIFRETLSVKELNFSKVGKLYGYSSAPPIDIFKNNMLDFENETSPIFSLEKFFLKKHLPTLLKRLDRSSMASGVEARVPFLDHNVIEYVVGSSVRDRITQENYKINLKSIARKHIPTDLVERQKVGFPIDLLLYFPEFRVNDSKTLYSKWLEWNYEILQQSI